MTQVMQFSDSEIHLSRCVEHPRTHIELTLNRLATISLCFEDAYDLAESISLFTARNLKHNRITAKK